MRVPIELDSVSNVRRFTEIVQSVDCDVRLVGKDENGNDWDLSAKSLFCSLIIEAKLQDREHTAHDVDWNTIWCECDTDIYHLIDEFVKG